MTIGTAEYGVAVFSDKKKQAENDQCWLWTFLFKQNSYKTQRSWDTFMMPTYIYEFINDIYFHDAIKLTETHSGDT